MVTSFQWWQVFELSCVHHRSCLVLMAYAYLSDHTHYVSFKVALFKIYCCTTFWDPTINVEMIHFTFSYHNLCIISCVPSCGVWFIPAFMKVFQLVQSLFQRTYTWTWWTTLWLPSWSVELPTRKIKAVWEQMHLHTKVCLTSSDDLHMITVLYHMKTCSFLWTFICHTLCHLLAKIFY
jgi:hypothetical protein